MTRASASVELAPTKRPPAEAVELAEALVPRSEVSSRARTSTSPPVTVPPRVAVASEPTSTSASEPAIDRPVETEKPFAVAAPPAWLSA